MDNEKNLYVTDKEKHEVRRYSVGDTIGTVVAGGYGQGAHSYKLDNPTYVVLMKIIPST